jgi:hypothetical protein
MKHVLIRYHFREGSKDEWHRDIASFIESLEGDPTLRGKISYRAMKTASGDYYHLATAIDQDAADLLGEREFFNRYTRRTNEVAGGQVEVVALEIVAETG